MNSMIQVWLAEIERLLKIAFQIAVTMECGAIAPFATVALHTLAARKRNLVYPLQ
jgi:hypothetical protein